MSKVSTFLLDDETNELEKQTSSEPMKVKMDYETNENKYRFYI